eukprot:PhM_4_TR16403/c0_g1_i1/m.61770
MPYGPSIDFTFLVAKDGVKCKTGAGVAVADAASIISFTSLSGTYTGCTDFHGPRELCLARDHPATLTTPQFSGYSIQVMQTLTVGGIDVTSSSDIYFAHGSAAPTFAITFTA